MMYSEKKSTFRAKRLILVSSDHVRRILPVICYFIYFFLQNRLCGGSRYLLCSGLHSCKKRHWVCLCVCPGPSGFDYGLHDKMEDSWRQSWSCLAAADKWRETRKIFIKHTWLLERGVAIYFPLDGSLHTGRKMQTNRRARQHVHFKVIMLTKQSYGKTTE